MASVKIFSFAFYDFVTFQLNWGFHLKRTIGWSKTGDRHGEYIALDKHCYAAKWLAFLVQKSLF